MNYEKPRPGDDITIPAELWGQILDAIGNDRGRGFAQKPPAPRYRQQSAGIIKIQNKSGAVIEPFRAVALKEPVVLPGDNEDEFKRVVRMNVITPTAAHRGLWGITQDGLPVDGWGECVVCGVSVARVNVANKKDKWAESVPGSTILKTADDGTGRLLWVKGGVGSADATGEQWAIVTTPPGGEEQLGQAQHQIRTMVTQNKAGWSMALAVPDLKQVET